MTLCVCGGGRGAVRAEAEWLWLWLLLWHLWFEWHRYDRWQREFDSWLKCPALLHDKRCRRRHIGWAARDWLVVFEGSGRSVETRTGSSRCTAETISATEDSTFRWWCWPVLSIVRAGSAAATESVALHHDHHHHRHHHSHHHDNSLFHHWSLIITTTLRRYI